MEETLKLKPYYSLDYKPVFIQLSFILLCLRGYFSGIITDTLSITLLLNFLIALSINYRKASLFILVFFPLATLTIYNRDALALLDILAFTYLLRNYPYRKLVKLNLIILLFYIIIWYVLLSFGIITDKLMIMPKGIAHCMGYENPNQFGSLGFFIIASLFLYFSKSNRWILLILIPIINSLFYDLSFSRTPWISGYVLMIIIILDYLGIIRKFRYIISSLPIIILCCLIYIAKNVENYPELDILFTTRFSNYALLLNRMTPVTWLIGIPQSVNNMIDSSYFMLICSGGIGYAILFWYKYIQTILSKWKIIVPYLPFILSCLSMAIGENFISSANPLSVLFWTIIFNPQLLNKSHENRSINLMHAPKG